MLRSGCGAAAETKEENIRETKWRPADRRTGGRAKRITDENGETEKTHLIWEWTGFQTYEESGTNVDGFGCRSDEERNSSMEK